MMAPKQAVSRKPPPALKTRLGQSFEVRWKQLADDSPAQGAGDRVLQLLLEAAARAYAIGLGIRSALYSWSVAKVDRAAAPVISIGNLSVGGTGKTPIVRWLARELMKRGLRPAILSRGYGGAAERLRTIPALVVSDGQQILFPPEIAGDEPVELALSLPGVPVAAGRRRASAAQLAVDRFRPDTLILDDGFQHRALARQYDIVVVDASRAPGALRLFPRGSLREGLDALERAHAVILTRVPCPQNAERKPATEHDFGKSSDLRGMDREESGGESQRPGGAIPRDFSREWVDLLTKRFPHLLIARSGTLARGLRAAGGGERMEISPPQCAGRSAFLFCGVGNPGPVRQSLSELGLILAGEVLLPDHESFSFSTLEAIAIKARAAGADMLVCTGKDAAKIAYMPSFPAISHRADPGGIPPIFAVEFDVVFHDAQESDRLLKAITGHKL